MRVSPGVRNVIPSVSVVLRSGIGGNKAEPLPTAAPPDAAEVEALTSERVFPRALGPSFFSRKKKYAAAKKVPFWVALHWSLYCLRQSQQFVGFKHVVLLMFVLATHLSSHESSIRVCVHAEHPLELSDLYVGGSDQLVNHAAETIRSSRTARSFELLAVRIVIAVG